ncbi:MAG: diguanylate cyclase [Alphaproteobacteria bacterium]
MTENNENGASAARQDGRDIASAVGAAIGEHEIWLREWHRAAICGVSREVDVAADGSYLLCRFGHWFEDNSKDGMLNDELLRDLDRGHRELHEAGEILAEKTLAGEAIPADEYDTLLDAADNFARVARRVCETFGSGGEGEADFADDDQLATLQNRLNMLAELERERDRAVRTGTPMTIAVIRPDGLSVVEADYGRIGVDRVMASVATRLFAGLRPYDAVYRYSQSEILLCFPGADGGETDVIISRLMESLERAPIILSDEVEITISAFFGVSRVNSRDQIQKTVELALDALAATSPAARVRTWPLDAPE